MAASQIKLVSTNLPADNVPIDTHIILTYSGPVQASVGKITVYNSGGRVIQEISHSSGRITISGNVVTVDLPSDFAYNSSYEVRFFNNFLKDAAGNEVAGWGAALYTESVHTVQNLVGTSGDDTLHGGSQGDTLDGGDGNDQLMGFEGDDQLSGGTGNDSLSGSEGNDTLYGGAGADTLDGWMGDDLLEGGDGDDTLGDDYGSNTLNGGAGNDHLSSANNSSALIYGGDGDDFINASTWDTAEGGAGNDTIKMTASRVTGDRGIIRGGDGNDTIRVLIREQAGATVQAWGDTGIDTFELSLPYSSGSAAYTIRDFTAGPGGDKLDVESIYSSIAAYTSGNPLGPGGIIALQQDGNDTLVVVTAKSSYTGSVNDQLVRLSGVRADTLTRDNFAGGYSPLGGNGVGETVHGTNGADSIGGFALNDRLIGGAGNDTLWAFGGDDVLIGGAGNDSLIGYAGTDTAVMAGNRADFTIMGTASSASVTHKGTTEGRDMLSDVERIQFNDVTVALDISGAGGKVYRLYQAAFDRKPDGTGLGFWIAQADKGTSMAAIADGFIQSGEFKTLHGAAPTNAELVYRFYKNVLDREPDTSGQKFWKDILDTKAATVAEVLAAFAESAENVKAVASVIANGFEYTASLG